MDFHFIHIQMIAFYMQCLNELNVERFLTLIKMKIRDISQPLNVHDLGNASDYPKMK